MPTPRLSAAQLKRVAEVWNENRHLTYEEVGKKMGVSGATLKRRLTLAVDGGIAVAEPTNSYTIKKGAQMRSEHVSPELPDDDLTAEEIVAQRKKEFAQKRKHEEAAKLIPIQITIPGPIGILHFGDPHVDDDGTDIGAIEKHSDLTRQEGLFGANVGDTTNAWVGRLARLYAQQNMGRKRAIKIAEWFINRTRWLYMVGGNHDGWAGDDDPIKWIARQSNTLYRASEARIELRFPHGHPFTINARHDFAGSSQWNPTHGVMKAVQLGVRDELSTCGHKHVSGYSVLKDPAFGVVCHCLQVGSYKQFDRFAKDKGFRDQSLGPAALTVIRPDLAPQHPDRCKVFWVPEEGADYLKFQRRKK